VGDETVRGRKVIPAFLLMLAAHVAHVFEEAWGSFVAISVLGNLGLFLILNWVMICLILLLFWKVLLERRWAYRLGIVYAALMIVNGIVHNVGVIVTGEYSGGFAGSLSGIALIIVGPVLIYRLRSEMPPE
jgi:hypothetical protein